MGGTEVSGQANPWFNPVEFFKDGIPPQLKTGLQLNPDIRREIIELIKRRRYKNALEIGPGNQPVIKDVHRKTFLDAAEIFARSRKPHGVVGDVRNLPFGDKEFELVVMVDVLTHIWPPERERVISEAARCGTNILICDYEIRTLDGEMLSRDPEYTIETAVDLSKIRDIIGKLGLEIVHRKTHSQIVRWSIRQQPILIRFITEIIIAEKK